MKKLKLSVKYAGLIRRMKVECDKKNAIRRRYVSQFYYHNKISFIFASLSALLTGIANLFLTWIMQQMTDSVSGVQGAMKLNTLAMITIAAILFIIIIKFINYVSQPKFIAKAMQQYKDFIFENVMKKGINAFNKETTTRYISAFANDALSIENNYLNNFFTLIREMTKALGAIVMMLLYSPIMAIIACVFFLLPIGISLLIGDRVEKAECTVSDKNESFVDILKDSFSGFAVIKSFKAENAIKELFSERNRDVENAKCKKRKISTSVNTMGSVAGIIAQFGTFLIGGYLAMAGFGITPGILLVFVDLTADVINPIKIMPELFSNRNAAIALMDKMIDSLNINRRDGDVYMFSRLKKGIEIKDVSFCYEKQNEILHSINIMFEVGKSYVIVGTSGSGKSTFLNLLMGGIMTIQVAFIMMIRN